MLKSLTLALGVLLAFTSYTVNALYSAGDDVLQLDEKTFDKTGKCEGGESLYFFPGTVLFIW